MSSPGDVRNDPALVGRFVELFQEFGTLALISDLETEVSCLTIAGRDYPVTVNDGGVPGNGYLCTPSTAYIDYALDETRNFSDTPLVARATRALIRLAAPLVRASGLDRQVQLNNWLYSTNPMPALDHTDAASIRDRLVTDHPSHAIVIRSLNEMADPATIAALRQAGFRMLASRMIYVVPERVARMGNAMKQDRAQMRRTPHSYVGNDAFTEADYARSEELYNLLYLDKYTPLNPHYTATYIREMHRRGILRLAGYREADGDLVAVTGLFTNGTTLTQPIVGYDTSRDLGEGLYRMIMALAQDHAFEHGLFFNMSAGAGDFKRRRAARAVVEYSAVYVGHLPRRQRRAVAVMEVILRRIGVPLLQRFEL